MRKCLFLLLPVGMVLIMLTVGLSAKNLDTEGKAWLDAHNEAAAIDVDGVWYAKEWGKIFLKQTEGSRDLTGTGDGWDIMGVVSGKQVFLLFSHHGKVNYSAELTSEGENGLNGFYTKGFVDDKAKHKSMRLTKQ